MTYWMIFHIIGAYLLGSISSAILFTRLTKRTDIREVGSGNPGATNILRVAGKRAALFVFVFDVLKGMLPVYSGFLLGYPPMVLSCIAVSACLGHMYPVYFNFKGGKAVATALGAMMPLDWLFTILVLLTWVGVFLISRISSVAAIATLVLAPLYVYWIKPDYFMAVLVLCILIICKHYKNIIRLIKHQENKFKRR